MSKSAFDTLQKVVDDTTTALNKGRKGMHTSANFRQDLEGGKGGYIRPKGWKGKEAPLHRAAEYDHPAVAGIGAINEKHGGTDKGLGRALDAHFSKHYEGLSADAGKRAGQHEEFASSYEGLKRAHSAHAKIASGKGNKEQAAMHQGKAALYEQARDAHSHVAAHLRGDF